MKLPQNPQVKFGLISTLLCLGLVFALHSWSSTKPRAGVQNPTAEKGPTATPHAATNPVTAIAQNTQPSPEKKDAAVNSKSPPESAPTNAPPPAAKPESSPKPASAAGMAESPAPPPLEKNPPPANPESPAQVEPANVSPSDEIQLSFQGANIDLVVQWLAKTTGKSVVKHPKVQCQLTIVSSKKLSLKDAVTLVYRALALEGFTTLESGRSILIVPEGQEPKLSPELLDASRPELLEGRQRLVKIFPLKHIQAAELKEKVRGVLSEKATIDANDRANQLIVMDYTDNMRLVGELIKELDVISVSEAVIEIYSLKHAEAEELANLLGLIMNTPSTSAGAMPGQPAPGQPMPGAPPPGQPMPGQPMPGGPPRPSPGGLQPSGQQVRFWPDKTSNRLIVAAPKSKLPEVKRLLGILDTEKPQDVTIRVIPLKNVSPEDLAKEIAPLYQKMSGKSLKDIIEVAADSRSSSLIVLASESNFKAIQKLIATLDTEEAQEKVMQAFALKNADAEDVAKQLQELNQDQDSASRYFYYFSPSASKNSKKLSVVADRRRNTVVVQAPPASMDRIAKMIAALDEPVTDDTLAPKIFPLKYISATDVEEVLNELFLKKQQQRSYWDYYEGSRETTDRNVGRLYGKVRITSEPFSNALIITANSQENLAALEEILKKLDVPSPAGETTLRVGLQFAKALTVAHSINILFAKGGSPPLRPVSQPGPQGEARPSPQPGAPSQSNFELEQESKEEVYYPWLGGQQDTARTAEGRTTVRPVSDLVGRVRVVPDKRSNSLLITCNVHFFPQIMKLVHDLDAPTPQVLIAAKILEISSDFRDKLGVRWSPDGKSTFGGDDLDNSIMVGNKGEYTKVFAGNALADSLHKGILNSQVNLDLLVQFLRKNTDATVLAEPQINIADNELGRLFVGAQVPFINNSQLNSLGSRNDSFEYKNVGVILEVTPHINNDAEVALKIRAESSNIRIGETLFGGAILDTRNFRSDLMVKSGQTVVLGGIIQKEHQDVVRKVPLLGSIPGLGWLFKKKDKLSREVELMVFLSPTITRTPDQAKALIEEVGKKAPNIQKWMNDTPPVPEKIPPPKKPAP